jgi:hypothetical protein
MMIATLRASPEPWPGADTRILSPADATEFEDTPVMRLEV